MSDSYVQVATDGSGKKIDNTSLTREKADPAWSSTAGDTVYRQRVVLGSDDDPDQVVDMRGESGRASIAVHSKELDELLNVVTEIRDLLRLAIGA